MELFMTSILKIFHTIYYFYIKWPVENTTKVGKLDIMMEQQPYMGIFTNNSRLIFV